MTPKTKTVMVVMGWACVLAIPLAWGCGSKPPPSSASSDGTPASTTSPAAPTAGAATGGGGTKRAIAKIATTSDGGINGQATFTATGDQVEVALDLQKAPPGQRAWHIHEGRSCGRDKLADGGMGPPGSAAGPHWNPKKVAHGFPNAKSHHPGDFGNFPVDPSGKGTAKLSASGFNLDDTGELSVERDGDTSAHVTLKDYAYASVEACQSFTGYYEGICESLKLPNAVIQKEKCRANNDPFCVWRFGW
jgi:Cu-Zn family superoxide dismutase